MIRAVRAFAAVGVLSISVSAGATDPEPSDDCGFDKALRALQWATFTTDQGLPAVRVDAPPGLAVEFDARVSLEHLEHRWTEGPWVTGDAPLVVSLAVPAEAWLDDAAADYLTDLYVEVRVGGRIVTPGRAFLAWPQGRLGAPVVWTKAEAAVQAPQGTLRAELRQEGGGAIRVHPSLDGGAR
jgi:hypothetical protein